MGNCFKLEKSVVLSNDPLNANTIKNNDAICDNLVIAAHGSAGNYLAIRLSFEYGEGAGLLAAKRKIGRITLAPKNGWRASGWVFDHINKRCSCLLTRRDSSVFRHEETVVELDKIECYGQTDKAQICVELLTPSGQAAGTPCVLNFSKKYGIKILAFGPDYPEIDAEEKPKILFSASCSLPGVKPAYELFRVTGGRTEKLAALTENRDFTESAGIAALLKNGMCEELKYLLKVRAAGLPETSAECAVRIAEPQVRRFKSYVSEKGARVSWDVRGSVFSRTNGENRAESADEPWELAKSNYRCNLFCTGYKRYISGALFSSKENWLYVDRLCRQITYEHTSVKWDMTLDWNIVSFAELTLTQTGAASVKLPAKGNYRVSGSGNLPEWTLRIKGGGNETTIPLHENMPETIEASLRIDARSTLRELRYLEMFLHFLLTLIQQNPDPHQWVRFAVNAESIPGEIKIPAVSAWHGRRWQVFGECWTRLVEYDRFFYISECESDAKLTYTSGGKVRFKESISSYQYYVLLYLACRKMLILKGKYNRHPLELTQVIEFFRLAGEAGAGELPYRNYSFTSKNDAMNELYGKTVFCKLFDVFSAALGGSWPLK